jgi:hypothetical protein
VDSGARLILFTHAQKALKWVSSFGRATYVDELFNKMYRVIFKELFSKN